MIEIRKARFTETGNIDMDFRWGSRDWVPYTASEGDVEPLSAALYHIAINEQEIEPYSPPEPAPAPTPPPPPELTPDNYPLRRWEFRAMVDYLGLEEKINEFINNIADDLTRAVVRRRVWDSDEYSRRDSLFDTVSSAIGLPVDDLDAAWMAMLKRRG